jgi:hypothetical protein
MKYITHIFRHLIINLIKHFNIIYRNMLL